MKLAIISDIHGNLIALETALAAIDSDGVDKIWVLGDLAAHGSRPAECVALIRERKAANKDNFKVIGGNTERYLVNNLRLNRPVAKDEESYKQLVQRAYIDDDILNWGRAQLGWENYEFLSKIIGKETGMTVHEYGYVSGYHAIPGDDEYIINADTPDEEALDSVLDRSFRLGIYGHIHQQVNRNLGHVRLVNPGSVGMSFQSPGKVQFAVLTFTDGDVNIDLRELDYDVDAAVADLSHVGYPHIETMTNMLRKGTW